MRSSLKVMRTRGHGKKYRMETERQRPEVQAGAEHPAAERREPVRRRSRTLTCPHRYGFEIAFLVTIAPLGVVVNRRDAATEDTDRVAPCAEQPLSLAGVQLTPRMPDVLLFRFAPTILVVVRQQ